MELNGTIRWGVSVGLQLLMGAAVLLVIYRVGPEMPGRLVSFRDPSLSPDTRVG